MHPVRVWRRFLFTRSEMLGVIGLAAAIILIRVLATAVPLATIAPPSPELAKEPVREQLNQQPVRGNVRQAARSSHEPDTEVAPKKGTTPRQKAVMTDPVEVNGADTIRLLDLTGIGPAFARRIFKYREMLGGFAFKEQLLQVYGMDSTRYAGFVNEITIDTTLLRRLNVNEAAFRDLLRHPYLEYEQVKAICNYRDRKGEVSNLSELWTAGVLPDSLQKWLEPYLKTR
ncbi:MAG: helix-hairpin-helix domain-containing protein [Bacteroidales bacterium]